GQRRNVKGLVRDDVPPHSYQLQAPSLELYCDSPQCGGIRYFDSNARALVTSTNWYQIFLNYKCRHCEETTKQIAVQFYRSGGNDGEAVKLGEWPPFGPHVPTKMFALLGPDQHLFNKGQRAESQGMGIGAFAYYRRVVESQKNRLIDEIIKVSKV